jgi:hypothetical protein
MTKHDSTYRFIASSDSGLVKQGKTSLNRHSSLMVLAVADIYAVVIDYRPRILLVPFNTNPESGSIADSADPPDIILNDALAIFKTQSCCSIAIKGAWQTQMSNNCCVYLIRQLLQWADMLNNTGKHESMTLRSYIIGRGQNIIPPTDNSAPAQRHSNHPLVKVYAYEFWSQ